MGNIQMQDYGVYVINLDSREDRLKYIDRVLKEQNISYKRVSAINGKKFNYIPGIVESQGYSDLGCLGNKERDSHLAHTGCYMSHIKCLKMAMNNLYTRTLILEDDAKFIVNNSNEVIMNILKTNQDADIIWFNAPHEDEVIQKYEMPTWGLQGYMVNKKAAKILYDMLNPDSIWLKHKEDCLIDLVLPIAVKESKLNWKFFSLISQNKNFTSNIANS
jgi:GR25 family glycosyltransferase involved in LPS biosynthesis